jgi:hypothetical protein
LVGRALVAGCNRLTEHPGFSLLYPEFLFLLHTIVRGAVPLMVDAREQLLAVRTYDRLADPLIEYFGRHVEEERGHDEWILEDLEVLGVPRKETVARIPSPTVAGLVGAQYYWIRHHHPVVLLGYIAVLENHAPSVASVDALGYRAGVPADALRTLREHAAVDDEHARDLDRVVDSLVMTDAQFLGICINAAATVRSLVQCVDELIAEFEASLGQAGGKPPG